MKLRFVLCLLLAVCGAALIVEGFIWGIWQDGSWGHLAMFFLGLVFVIGGVRESGKGGGG